MPERAEIRLPNEREQVINFARARRKLSEVPYKPGHMQKGIILGLMTVLPGEIKSSGILNNPQRMAVVDAFVAYQVRANDRLDFEGAGRNDIGNIIDEARQEERLSRFKLDVILQALPDGDRSQVAEVIDTSLQEVEVVERWIRERRDSGTLDFTAIDIYRNTVNAIENVSTTAMVLGPGRLASHIQPIPEEQRDIQSILDKYAWVLGNHPATPAERAVMIMHNISMAVQIIDDLSGQRIDALLRIPTYASGARALTSGDRKAARAILNGKIAAYKAKARELGLGKLATEGALGVMSVAEKVGALLTRKARNSERGRRLAEKHFPYLRETKYITGQLDKRTAS